MKYLHTMIRVQNLESALDFFINKLGMIEVRRREAPEGRFTLVFLATGPGESTIELTYNWDTDKYDLGNGYGHIALGVDDIYSTCKKIELEGGKVTRKPGPMKHGSTVIAFIEDPNGYKVELIELGTQKVVAASTS